MKKLLIFKTGHVPGPDEVEDYLEESEVIRSAWIDMTPHGSEHRYIEDGVLVHMSDWEVVFKNDDKYDQWHLIIYPDSQDAGLLLEPYRREGVLTLTTVLYKRTFTVMVYRIAKDIATFLQKELDALLSSYNNGSFTYVIAPEIFDPLVLQSQTTLQEDSDAGTG